MTPTPGKPADDLSLTRNDPRDETAGETPPTRVGPDAPETDLAFSAAAAFDDLPGYEILGELGRGGMGVVYKARQTSLNRIVALKMVLAGQHAGRDALARFQAEAELIARLHHPNIVQVYDLGRHRELPFLAMEYVEGGSLDRAIAGRPTPPRDAARLVATLARAVHAAHGCGVVHRDLKPANVLLASEGRQLPDDSDPSGGSRSPLAGLTPKITDFGLAKDLGGPGRTAAGAVLGTPSYMAPEQAAGKPGAVGPHTDVHALGTILYELLTGRPPFKGDSVLETLDQVRTREPEPPRQCRGDVPADLEAVCLKCLRKDPAERYATAEALADDLERWLAGRAVSARTAGPLGRLWRRVRRRGLWARLAAALALMFCGALLAVWYWTPRLGLERHPEPGPEVSRAGPSPGSAAQPSSDAPTAAARAPEVGGFALLVGVDRYRLAGREMRFRYPEHDAEDVFTLLRDAGFPRANLRLLTVTYGEDVAAYRPTGANVRAQLHHLKQCADSPLALVFLSGHGVQAAGSDVYEFVPADGTLDDPATRVPLTEFYDALAACPAPAKLLVVDTCRSRLDGGTPAAWPPTRRPPPGVAAIFSCSAGEECVELDDLKHGLFSYFFLKGLGGQADRDDDGAVTLAELIGYLRGAVDAYTEAKGLKVRQTLDAVSSLPGTTVLLQRGKQGPTEPRP